MLEFEVFPVEKGKGTPRTGVLGTLQGAYDEKMNTRCTRLTIFIKHLGLKLLLKCSQL